ncbi:MAG: M20/M25/M40 family metallo-hydrolase [Bacteroidetes bacterium]|nr:M20/M25/M40 family metallo-hydrolase [Bacteroidota bacterium]MBU1113524.1 M20/M25/M40 family metallo-hydrolase [Bacteroidota bacterium]MBU1797472.1 M20/M25/M40 family metallo-hydrolase [Bacteroidota bacterium]
MKKTYLLLLVLFVLVFQNVNAQYQITSENLIKTVSYLSSKELQGRLGGSKGYFEAANFMANEFAEIGLIPFNKNSYFQNLKVEYNQILPKAEFSIYKDGNFIKKYNLGKDYVFRGFSGAGDINAQVVFAGYGISIQEYDDYKNIDVKGKIVLVFKYNPKWKIDGVNFPSSLPREKARVAREHGAVGIMFISFPNDKNPQQPIGSTMHGNGEQVNIPQIHIDLPVANEFFEGSKYTLKELQTKIDSEKTNLSFALKSEAKIFVETEYVKDKETVNVIGIYPGSDEKLKDEFVILGAHLDHVGGQAGEIYFPGANDNASGSASVLEVARMFAKNKLETKRSVMFVLFSNEESGLEGAEYLANNLGFDSNKVTAMLNMDCIAHGDSIQLGNGNSAPNLWQMAKKIDSENAKLSIINTWSGGGADATPFHEKRIPSLYFVTKNSYTHLHCLTDTPKTLNPKLYEGITNLAYLTILNLAKGEYEREVIAERVK